MELNVGDRVLLRKAHPCGSYEWVIYRVGADIGLRCASCGRRVMLTRSEFMKRLKRRLEASPSASPTAGNEGA